MGLKRFRRDRRHSSPTFSGLRSAALSSQSVRHASLNGSRTQTRSPAFVADILGFAFGCPLLTIGAPRFVKWVRGRYLTGRLGYVRPKRRERAPLGHRVLLAIATGCVVFCVVFLGDLLFKNRNQWILALVGLFGGAIQIGFGWRYGVKRFVVTGLFLALFGAALSLTGLRLGIAMAAWLGAAGLVEFVTGGVVLLRFLAESEATEGSGGN